MFFRERTAMPQATPTIARRCVAETIGTFILVFFGCGAVHADVLTGAQAGLWQVAIVWGIAIMLAVYVVGGISGAHINPAVTVALAVWGKFSWKDVGPYVAAQVAGAFLAAAALFSIFSGFLSQVETVERGKEGSERTAMCYGEYFPNPGLNATKDLYRKGDYESLAKIVNEPTAFLAEVLGTLFLGLAVFALTDPRNRGGPAARFAPVFIGLTVAILISVISPLTQACFNPARDFGPRLFAFIAGWGSIAIPGITPTGFFTVYILAPTVGAVIGGGLYLHVLRPSLPEEGAA
jgi:glycerol uptake facilitator protein